MDDGRWERHVSTSSEICQGVKGCGIRDFPVLVSVSA